jgi:magnesium-transporting ATPase (P-type)
MRTSLTSGLTSQQADIILKRDGYNQVTQPKRSLLWSVIHKFTSPSALMLQVTVVIASLPQIHKYGIKLLLFNLLY